MCSCHGGKQRIGKELAEIIYQVSTEIEDEYDFDIKGYCEPFSGMMGVYRHIPDLFKETHPNIEYLAGELNGNTVKMWNAAKRGWKPPHIISKTEYYKLKEKKGTSAIKGYVGHQYSFGGVYFSGYAPAYGKNKNSKTAAENVRSIGKLLKKNNVKITEGDYRQFSNLKGYILYLDPPYNNSTKHYKGDFDHLKFNDWCRRMSRDNVLFISEYNMPRDFELIFSKSRVVSYKGAKANKNERLYLIF